MSAPATSTATLRWATVAAGGPEVVEPDNTHKDNGWTVGEEPPHTYFNWWQHVAALWLAYLENLPNELMTWTAAHVFNAAVTMTAGLTLTNASGPALTATGTGTNPGLSATSGNALNAIAIFGLGAARTGVGGNGTFGQGGTGTVVGGFGLGGTGGDGNGLNASGGAGGTFTGGRAGATGNGTGGDGAVFNGGSVNGATNTAGAGGNGAEFFGGDIFSDANGRRGGTGIKVAGGQGQAGYGKAIEVTHGDVVVDTGDVTLTAGSLSAGGGIGCNGGMTAQLQMVAIGGFVTPAGIVCSGTGNFGGGLVIEAVNALPLVNSWADIGGSNQTSGYWKQPDSVVRLQGILNAAPATSATIATLPAGYRPNKTVYFTVDDGSGTQRLVINSAGVITCTTHGVGGTTISLEGISFRV